MPQPLQDVTGPGRGTVSASQDVDARALFDNSSATRVSLTGDAPRVQYDLLDDRRQQIRFYTLTSGEAEGDAAADPQSWVLKGSNDGRR
ncbi:MAG: hypothetical protein ACRD2C_10675 [Acidimicrobiales bacterium]